MDGSTTKCRLLVSLHSTSDYGFGDATFERIVNWPGAPAVGHTYACECDDHAVTNVLTVRGLECVTTREGGTVLLVLMEDIIWSTRPPNPQWPGVDRSAFREAVGLMVARGWYPREGSVRWQALERPGREENWEYPTLPVTRPPSDNQRQILVDEA